MEAPPQLGWFTLIERSTDTETDKTYTHNDKSPLLQYANTMQVHKTPGKTFDDKMPKRDSRDTHTQPSFDPDEMWALGDVPDRAGAQLTLHPDTKYDT